MTYKRTMRYLSKLGMKYIPGYLKPLKDVIIKSNLNILYDSYIGKMIFFSILGFFAALFAVTIVMMLYGFSLLISFAGAFVVAITLSVVILILFHSYPFNLLRVKKVSIENNLPFAINHMSAISSSGVPPYVVFKLISEIKEYGELRRECSRIVRNIDIFGMDLTSAIKNVGNRTPSPDFRKFLLGIVSTIETGGSMFKYLKNSSKEYLFDYKIKRESYIQALSTYADIYTAVLIAAPLFFVSVLSIMALVGGEVLGLTIPTALRLGIYGLVPLMNIAFLLFIHYTQPSG